MYENDFMVSSFFKKYMNVSDPGSFITKLRVKRFILFNELVSDIQPPVKILDIGGTVNFWEKWGVAGDDSYEIIVLNMDFNESGHSNIKVVVGDARDLSTYSSNQFDVVFSNSVIEHVGTYDDQRRMAEEVQRVGRRYFIQTPNYYFPFEPHFLFPFYQFFPQWLKVLLIQNFNLGWRTRLSR
ncbi:class I SAM-dependent methyltransferase [Methanolobus sp. WCC5]|uniref:class I SAM-dependent methyltransferase n=1 Tax=Methanolobus sp. WCC5 TaxID=3125785 RepID=UPI0032456CDF